MTYKIIPNITVKLETAQWLALVPHSRKVLGSNVIGVKDFSVWSVYVLHVSAWSLARYPGFLLQHKEMYLGISHLATLMGVNGVHLCLLSVKGSWEMVQTPMTHTGLKR